MKKTAIIILLMVWIGLSGCSMQPMGGQDGVGVVFDGQPRIFDSTVIYMGMPVGQVQSTEYGNGVTRLLISLDGSYEDLKKNNMAAVVKNGQLHLNALSGHGAALPPATCIIGFINTSSYRWFKFIHLINNINMSAERRAQRLLLQSGLSG